MLDKPDRRVRPKAKEQSATTTVAPPCAMVIFGAAGDLTKRLVVPALYNLANDHQLSEEFRLVGVDLTDMSAAQWRANLTDAMKGFVAHDGEFHLDEFAQTTWQWLTERMSYLLGDLNNPETYRRLGEHLTG
jgi:glucose-6-phosphate 1-dehydrogenase